VYLSPKGGPGKAVEPNRLGKTVADTLPKPRVVREAYDTGYALYEYLRPTKTSLISRSDAWN